jgi:hypothetical protein
LRASELLQTRRPLIAARRVGWPCGAGLPRSLAMCSKAIRHDFATSCDRKKSSIATKTQYVMARFFDRVAFYGSSAPHRFRPTPSAIHDARILCSECPGLLTDQCCGGRAEPFAGASGDRRQMSSCGPYGRTHGWVGAGHPEFLSGILDGTVSSASAIEWVTGACWGLLGPMRENCRPPRPQRNLAELAVRAHLLQFSAEILRTSLGSIRSHSRRRLEHGCPGAFSLAPIALARAPRRDAPHRDRSGYPFPLTRAEVVVN